MSSAAVERDAFSSMYQGPGRYHQNWFAVGLSEDFPAGTVKGLDFLGGRVVVWRGENGVVSVQSAYCAHLGADLSVGEVCGNQLQCEFHHWEYGQDGRCAKIPASADIPEQARIFAFPTEEKWGLVWAFNGPEPLFDVPTFRDLDESEAHFRVTPHAGHPVEPWMLITNAYDMQHLKYLHGLQIVEGPDNFNETEFGLEYDCILAAPDGPRMSIKARVVGTNTTALTIETNGIVMGGMFTGMYARNYTTGRFISATPLRSDSDADRAAANNILDMAQTFGMGLAEEDKQVMDTIRFRPGVLIEADKELKRYFDYVSRFPTADPLGEL